MVDVRNRVNAGKLPYNLQQEIPDFDTPVSTEPRFRARDSPGAEADHRGIRCIGALDAYEYRTERKCRLRPTQNVPPTIVPSQRFNSNLIRSRSILTIVALGGDRKIFDAHCARGSVVLRDCVTSADPPRLDGEVKEFRVFISRVCSCRCVTVCPVYMN
jgi:hypothetical protein